MYAIFLLLGLLIHILELTTERTIFWICHDWNGSPRLGIYHVWPLKHSSKSGSSRRLPLRIPTDTHSFNKGSSNWPLIPFIWRINQIENLYEELLKVLLFTCVHAWEGLWNVNKPWKFVRMCAVKHRLIVFFFLLERYLLMVVLIFLQIKLLLLLFESS